jgi:glycolate dehydrogenase FAD-binding subunit
MGPSMTEIARPQTIEQVADAVRAAIVEGRPLELMSGGSKRAFGRPSEADACLDLSALSGIVLYEPEELVLTAKPGTPLAEVESVLAQRRQHLAFEPPDLAPLLDTNGVPGANVRGTLGGAIACNLSGPRRIKAGAARDHVLGFHAVSGRGEPFKAGGRVVKNVTGFDLSKLIAGSFGTLAAMTELTVRALPAPEETRTVVVLGVDNAGVREMTAALASPFDVSGAAHLPAEVAAGSSVGAIASAGMSATLLRLEGTAPSVSFRAAELARLFSASAPLIELDVAESVVVWREVRDVAYFSARPDRQIWRLSVPPASGAEVVKRILDTLVGHVFYDWSGGLIWLALAPSPDASEPIVRGVIEIAGGHATLIRAAGAVRERVPVFQPQPPALAALTRRIKQGFDPGRVLNPGRMYEGV